jgi:hypothetical protein
MSTAAELGFKLGREKSAQIPILEPVIGGITASHYSDPGDKEKLYTVLKGALYGTGGALLGALGGGLAGAGLGYGAGRLAGAGSRAMEHAVAIPAVGGAVAGDLYGAYKGGRAAAYKKEPEQETKKEPKQEPKQEKKGAEVEEQPNTSDKQLKPLAADKPAASDQKPATTETQPSNQHPSASPAKPANEPAGTEEHGSTEQIPDKQKTQKRAALRRAEILSVLYKFGSCSKTMKKKIKKAELRETIKSVGVEKVAALVSALRG